MDRKSKITLKGKEKCGKGLLSDIHLEPIKNKPFSLEEVVTVSLEAFRSDKELIQWYKDKLKQLNIK